VRSYLLLLCITKPIRVSVGSLGEVALGPGTYGYVGSALRGLPNRLRRHCSKGKRIKWHIDYLTARDDVLVYGALVPRSTAWDEESLAEELSKVAEPSVRGFGSSDVRSYTHLFKLEAKALGEVCGMVELVFIGCSMSEGVCEDALSLASSCPRA